MQDGQTLLAGTSDGLYRWTLGAWNREKLPSELPVQRPNGIVQVGSEYVIGGLGGLYVGAPGAWKQVSKQPVRQILADGMDAWVVFGSGAVDKLEPESDRLYPDVLFDAARRPWASCVASVDGRTLFGGQEGWIEKGQELKEKYLPELSGDVVMAIAGRKETTWLGTQKTGLVRVGPSGVKVWNPGNGLTDEWVTSLCLMPPKGLIVGTATKGLFCLKGETIAPIEGPTQRVTCLCTYQGNLVVGGMDGAWIQRGKEWIALNSSEETTAVTVLHDRLAIACAGEVVFRTVD